MVSNGQASARDKPRATQRVAAFIALVSAAATVVIGIVGVLGHPLAILICLGAALLVVAGVVMFATSSGATRAIGTAFVIGGVAAWAWALIDGEAIGFVIGMILCDMLTTVMTLWAIRSEPYKPPAASVSPPRKPFIVMNRKSGGGKVKKFDLDARARQMGAEVAYLEPGVDVVEVLGKAVADGADLLGAAGGDGTQALVAEVAAEHHLPMLCIPAGTKNHFALDLGLDREDPSLALLALGDEGEEIQVDLGMVGGRPFVNNVSLGLYAEMVARPDYRDAKLETTLAVLPGAVNPESPSGLTVDAPGREPIRDPQLVQVANNPYAAPEEAAPFGTRPRLDTGKLGIDVIAFSSASELRKMIGRTSSRPARPSESHRSWTGERLSVSSDSGTVPAGVDGEYVEFPSPLEISIRPGALQIRVPTERPGPKKGWPQVDGRILLRLWSIVAGHGNVDQPAIR